MHPDAGEPSPATSAEGPPGPVVLLVDAANVVGSRPDGWWRDRAGAAGRLLTALRRLPGRPGALPAGRTATEVVVVLEGAARPAAAPGVVAPGLVVAHAPAAGDDALAERCSRGVLLVTSDRGLRARALAAGAEVLGAGALLHALDAAAPRPGPDRS